MIVYESFVSKKHPLEIDGGSVKKEKKKNWWRWIIFERHIYFLSRALNERIDGDGL